MKRYIIIAAVLVSAITQAHADNREITSTMPLSGPAARFVGQDSITLTSKEINDAEQLREAMVQICRERDLRRTERVFAMTAKALKDVSPEYPVDSPKFKFFLITAYAAVKADMASRGPAMYSKPLKEGDK